MAKGKKAADNPFYTEVPSEFWTMSELKGYIQTMGKRAVSRIASLKKAYAPGGTLAGRQSYVLDRFGNLNTKTKGFSEKALRLKAEQIRNVLEAKSSTVKGVKEIDAKRLAAFMENHPKVAEHGVQYTDKRGRVRTRKFSKADWERAMKLMGKIQKAEKGAGYDSNEQLFMAFKLATTKDTGIIPTDAKETVSAENFLNESGAMTIHSDDFFAKANISETLNFFDTSKE